VRPRAHLGLVAAVLVALAAGPAVSRASLALPLAEIEGVRFAPRAPAGDRTLALRSLGLLRYRAVFKGYVAALYTEGDATAAELLRDVPKRLEIEYFWSIDGSKFGPAAEAVLRRNLDPAAFARIEPALERLHGAYEDVEPGDRYALTYVPGRGLELARNGEQRVLVPGAELAAAYFGIWLGSDPLDASLRDQLLGLR
jgi:hypothetical protein